MLPSLSSSLLALTATATPSCMESMCRVLEISKDCIWRSGKIRNNLKLTVSRELYILLNLINLLYSDREKALLDLLKTETFASYNSILIYVGRQKQADSLSIFLTVFAH